MVGRPKGHPKTGGRVAGKPNATTRKAREAAEQAAQAGITPLEFMLQVMRDPFADIAHRLDMAKAAAPYVSPRLANIEFKGSVTLNHEQALEELERQGA